MTTKEFEKLIREFFEKNCIGLMCGCKDKEYSRGGNKLHNFYRAAEFEKCSPIKALRGMKVKHTVSIYDMIDDLEKGITHSKEEWEEKIRDESNYHFLLWGLLNDKW